MKNIKLNYLIQKTQESFLEYPLTILCALLGTVTSIYFFEFNDDIKNPFPYINAILTFALGIPLYFSVSFLSGTIFTKQIWKINAYFLASIILLLIYSSLPNQEVTFNTRIPYIRYAVFNVIIHLLVSFSPFIKNKTINGFWNYNKTLFIRFWTAILYSGVLYLGIVLAITAVKLLFNIKFDFKVYFHIQIAIFGLFNTWFFVSGIPKNIDNYENLTVYPKGLKIFSQYILLPLLLVYLLILYTYGGKIIITNNWPKGIVTYLITAISVLGILTFLLLHPYGKQKEYKWIQKLSFFYYLLLLPLIVMLFTAVSIRINQYGITINRYLILLLGIWLSIVAIYFCLHKKNIKLIPVSLAIILAVSSLGPWGMFSISEKSQANRLLSILENHQLLKNGKVVNETIWNPNKFPELRSIDTNSNEIKISDSIHNEIKSILDYLDDHHGLTSINPIFEQDLDIYFKTAVDSSKHINQARVYMKTLGLDYKKIRSLIHDKNSPKKYLYFKREKTDAISVNGFDYYYNFAYLNSKKEKSFVIDNHNYNIQLKNKTIILHTATDSLSINLDDKIELLLKNHAHKPNSIPSKLLEYNQILNNQHFLIVLNNINLKQKDDEYLINSLNGYILIKNVIE
ncbi:hypothetical protein FHR24_002644 [Wenyingzhuangia heitensis]|uniref:DUF4153 domain-containing protein n=1 Tax=Wenyingzhuangia heitensis TaxID=1487859 RepID=A0ABX0UFG3_9FLAO|nr:DUF4153 domain-containing protein [Wenyingzhuangia heitensis]NIJ46166.1 hypothetical protein [Wenyingzhuangia heitensis]